MERELYEAARKVVEAYEGDHGSPEYLNIGTVEPISKEGDADLCEGKAVGFIRGVISKYKNAHVDPKAVIKYIEERIEE